MPYSHAHGHYHLMRMHELGRVFWCHSLTAIGNCLVMIFVPIFLLKSGYSFEVVLGYMIMQQLLATAVQYPASRLFAYIRPHRLIAIGNVCTVLMFGLLISLESHHWPLWLPALAWALNRAIYWSAFHYTFSIARTRKRAGRQIAVINALSMLAATAAPAIGGILATAMGINYTYVAAMALLVVAVLPMINDNSGPPTTKLDISWAEVKKMRRDLLANAFNGIALMAEQNIWPIFVFLLVSTYAGVGLLSSVIAAASIVVTIYVGRREEKTGERPYIRRGLATYSLTSLGRTAAQNSAQVFGLNLMGGIGRSLYMTPYLNRYYHNSDGPHRLGYITLMEAAFSVGAAFYIFGLLILAMLFPVKAVLAIGLGVVALCILGVRLIR